ncbi:unnamed protein product [Phyllotreta striolata]|uniref:Uncharacterized protein n=1 Tax=Phyllotreta striolata TaxID=444603 RepID=A0A9N9TEN1_PHYSR|nr:unnamed protein product [Phyllotreta striolata]
MYAALVVVSQKSQHEQFATLAVTSAAPSGLGLGLGLQLISPGTLLLPPSAHTIISKPAVSLGLAPALGPIAPIAPVALSAPILAPVAPAPAAVALTNGGGTIGVSGHGAIVSGPKTAPVVIEGPSGVVKADGLWGPTLAGVAAPVHHPW